MEKRVGGDCHNLPGLAAVQAELQFCLLPFTLFIPKACSQHGFLFTLFPMLAASAS